MGVRGTDNHDYVGEIEITTTGTFTNLNLTRH